MKIKMLNKLLISIPLLLTSFIIHAMPPAWKIVNADSTLTFTASQNNAPVTGEFKKFTGNIHFDEKDLKNSSADIIVDMNSLSVSYSDLHDTLLSADWFNIKAFPTAEFKATDFTKSDATHYQANGILTIRDHHAPVVLHFTLQQINANKVKVEGSTEINRTTFSVGQGEWASTKEVKDGVTINFVVNAVR